MDADWDMAYDVARLMGALVGFLAVSDKTDAAALAAKIKRMAAAALKEQIIIDRAALGENKLSVYDAAGKIRHQAQQASERLLSINRFWPGTVKKSDTAELKEIAEKAIAKIPVPAGKRPLSGAAAKAAEMIVKRLVPGPLCSLARIPHDERTSSTVLPVLLYLLLDGKRSLYDAVKLYEYEHSTVIPEQKIQTFMDHLHYLAKYGYVAILAE